MVSPPVSHWPRDASNPVMASLIWRSKPITTSVSNATRIGPDLHTIKRMMIRGSHVSGSTKKQRSRIRTTPIFFDIGTGMPFFLI